MSPFLLSEYSGSVRPLPPTLWLRKHSHESEACFRFLLGNPPVRQNSLHPEKEIRSEISDDSIEGFFQDLDSDQWRKRLYALFPIHFGQSFVSKQSGSAFPC